MKSTHVNITYFCIAALWSVAMLFSCSNSMKKIQQEAKTYKFPLGNAENFETIYTDSTRVKAILTSPNYLDFTNQHFPYTEFPKGLKVDFFDEKNQKSTVEALYGIYYFKTHMVELRDSVKLTTYEGKVLNTSQLFWNEKEDWIFTEKPFIYLDTVQKSITNGVGMDFDKSFTKLKAHKITGIVPLKE